MTQSWIRNEERRGAPVSAGDFTVTPVSRATILQYPRPGREGGEVAGKDIAFSGGGGIIWNRPSAVIVRDSEGTEQRLPVRDVTRIAQVLILGFGALVSILMWIALRPNSGKTGR